MMLEIAHATRPCKGERRSGDAVVFRTDFDRTLFGVVDILGHGDLAADAADQALGFLHTANLSLGIRVLLHGLHQQLRTTRGAAATLCLLSDDSLEVSGVGNVNLRSFGMSVGLVLTRGILGARMRDLRVLRCEAQSPTRLVIFSDGIRPTFPSEDATQGTPRAACERLLARHGSHRDDATVLIADLSAERQHVDGIGAAGTGGKT